MSFLDFLEEKGDAIKDFANKTKKDEDEKSSVEKLLDFQKAKDEAVITDTQKNVMDTDDTSETERLNKF